MKFSVAKAGVLVLVVISLVIIISDSVSADTYCKLCPGSSNNCWVCDSQPDPACPILPNITINSPVNDYVYKTNKILLDVAVSEQVQKIDVVVNGATSYSETLCTNCHSYSGMSRELKDGSYQFCIRITTAPKGPCQGNTYYPFVTSKCVHIDVSTKQLPIILDFSPKNNDVIIGSNAEVFWVRYNESSVKNASLIFRKLGEDVYHIVTRSDCPSGSNAQCAFTSDLSSYNNLDKIEYYFRVINLGGGMSFSNHSIVTIVRTLSSFEILSPIEGQTYGSTSVPLEVWANSTVKYIKRSIDGSSYSTLCSDCSRYNGTLTSTEGQHSLKIQVTDYSSNSADKTIAFSIDSKPPLISSQSPANNTYALGNTEFKITYTENYLMEIRLYIIRNPDLENETVEEYLLDGCPSGSSKTCSKSIDVNGYEPRLRYYFTISDYVRRVSSGIYTVNIDPYPPRISIISPENRNYGVKTINVEVNTNGELMKAIKYSADGSSYSTLCSNCNSYSTQKSFSEGAHYIDIMATDPADNTATERVNFFVDSTLPQIVSLTPANKSYIKSPEFSVKYTETNLQRIMLYWKGSGEEWQSASLQNCSSGSNKLCYSPSFLNPYFSFYPEHAKIDFFFRISDVVRDVNSTTNTVFYDNSPPQITIISPINNTNYSQTTLQINVQVHEKCKYIKYSVDGASYSTMCYDCSSYSTSKSFSRAFHTLSIKAEDYAGNVGVSEIRFAIN